MIPVLLIVVAVLSVIAVRGENGFSQHMIGFGKHKILNKNTQGVKLAKVSTPYTCDNVTENWFTGAVLDNFAPVDKQQPWHGKGQRYFVNKQLWGGNNYPIFVFIGGEGEEACTRLTSYLYMYQLAEEHRALLVDVEHRFYGQSIPTPDTSTENLKYLSSAQALADLARIISFVKKEYGTPYSKVVTVGGSYPGNLAAWFRLKYPHVTHGSIASSAPVLAQTNFPEYMDVVGQAILHFSGQKCYNSMETAANKITELASQGFGSEGMRTLEKDFQLCAPMKNDLDISVFLSELMGNVQITAQYNNEPSATMNFPEACQIMTQSDDAYGNFVQLQKAYRAANGQRCEDGNWDDMVEALKTTGAGRSWTYQTCNEFGYFQTTDSPNQPFHSWKWLGLDFYKNMCEAAFDGWKADPQVVFTNEYYGGTHISGTNTLLPHGSIDPWHALGVVNVTIPLPQQSEVKVYIEETAHCMDMYSPASSDPASLTWAREVIAGEVKRWLA
jgi:pimeloyl-ACP methyl ester carboxylesterase